MKPKMCVSLTRVLLVRDHRDWSTTIAFEFSSMVTLVCVGRVIPDVVQSRKSATHPIRQ